MKKIYEKILSIRPVNPLRITLIYLSLSLTWIFLSDSIAILADVDHHYITLFSLMKGFFFVLVTSAILYILIQNAILYTQKQIERSEKSEKIYKLISENINDVVWILNVANQKFSYVSPSILKQRGYTPEEIYEQSLKENLLPQYYQLVKDELISRINQFESGDESAKLRVTEIEQYCKNGSVIAVEITTSLIKNDEGKVIEICGRTENITNRKITRDALNALAISFSSLQGKILFEKVSEHIVKTLDVDCVYVGQLSKQKTSIRVLGGFKNGIPMPLVEYELKNSPCDTVVGKNSINYSEKVRKLFPKDKMLVEMGAESYMGAPLFDKNGNSLGLIVAVDSKPIRKNTLVPTLFKIFSERVAVEIERSNSEEAILKSEAKYHRLFNSNKDGIAIFQINEDGSTGKFLECNDAAAELQGYSKEEMLNLTPKDIELPPGEEELVSRKIELRENGVATFETKAKYKNGKDIDVEIKSVMIEYNQQPAIMNIVRNISERKRTEEALRKSEALYDLITQNSNDVIWLLSIETGKFTYVSPSVSKLRGYTPDEIINHTFADVVTPGSYNDIMHRLPSSIKAFENGELSQAATRIEVDQPCKDGSIVHTEVVTTFITNEQGKVYQILGVTRDITERKKIENALVESETKYELISKNSADVIWILSLEIGRMIYISPSVERLLGFTPEEVLQQSMKEALSPDSFEFITKNMKDRIQAFMKGDSRAKTTITEIGQNRKDGTVVYTEAMTTLVTNTKGIVTQIVGVSRDITERKRSQEALKKSESNLMTAMRIAKLGHWEYDFLLNLFTFNEQFYQLMHTSVKEVGSYFLLPNEYSKRFVYPEDQHLVGEEMRKALETKDPNYTSVLEHRIIFADGGVGYTSVHINVIKDQFGKTIKTYGVNQDITEKKLIEQAIKESEEKFRVSFVTSPDAVNINRLRDGLYLEVNDGFTRMTGYTKEDVLNKTSQEINIWADLNDRKKMVDYLIKEGVCLNLQAKFRLKDGRIKTGLMSATLITLQNEQCIISITRDITEYIQTQEALKESEERYKELYELSPDAIVVHQEGEILFINPAGLKIVGASSEYEILGKKMLDFVHPDYRAMVMERVKEMTALTQSVNPQYEKFLRLDGSSVDVEVVSTPIKLKGKIAYQVIARDVTERKKVEDIMRASEQKFSKIFENAPALITINTIENPRYIDANQMCCDVSGYTRDEIIGKSTSQIGWLAPGDRHGINNELERIGNVRNFSMQFITKDQKILDCLYYGEVIIVQEEKCLLSIILDITERKRAEELIKESEQKLSALINSTPDIICFKDAEGRWLKANQGILDTYGLSNYDYANKTEWDMAPYTYEIYKDAFRTCGITDELAWLKGAQSRTEEMIPDSNGLPRFFDVIKVPLFYENGNRKALVVFGRDITERKKSEHALRLEKDKFSKTFFTSPDGLIINRIADSVIIELNNGFLNLTGYSREELLFQSAREIDFWINRDKRNESKSRLLSDGIYQNLDTELRKKDGGIANVLVSASRIDVDGEDCVLYLFRDITSLHKTETALRESEERYRDLFSHLLDGFAYHELVLDDNGTPVDFIYLAANVQFEILTGLKNADIIGKSVMEVMPAKGKLWLKQYAPVALTGEPKRFESYNEDTELHYKVLAYSPERLKFATIIEDITERVLAERELKLYRTNLEQLVKLRTIELDSANKQLEDELRKDKEYEMMLQESLKKEKELSEIKTRFISTASHEFRTPLTSILSSTELIERYRKRWSDDKFDEHFLRVKSSVEYLTKLLDDVLLINRTDSGKISFEPSETSLKDFCVEVLREAAVYSKQNHSMVFKYLSRRKKFLLDQKLLKFILVNILSNAYKYSPNGGKVEFLVNNNRSNIIFSVSDEGIGIPEIEMEHLFEPFHRSKNSKDILGTGLGLSIVKRSIDLHKGKIVLESEVNKGTKIIVFLPLKFDGEE